MKNRKFFLNGSSTMEIEGKINEILILNPGYKEIRVEFVHKPIGI